MVVFVESSEVLERGKSVAVLILEWDISLTCLLAGTANWIVIVV